MAKYKRLCAWSFVCLFGVLAGCTPKQPGLVAGEAPRSSVSLETASDSAAAEEFDDEFEVADLDLETNFSLFRTDTPFELIKPTDGKVSSPFGTRRHPIKHRRIFHRGVDINAKRGTAVVAAASGKVVFTGVRGRGYGKTVEIRHDNGMLTRYAHLDAILVKPGQKVTTDTRIGKVGRTGRTTGPNLHFELLAGGKNINPEPFWTSSPWRKATALVQEKSVEGRTSRFN